MAPDGTVVVIRIAEFTVKLAAVPLNVTDVAPVKLVPLMITLIPTAPLVGEKLVIVGGVPTVKAFALMAVPEIVVTLIGPVVAPEGTVAVTCVSESAVKAADVPLKARTWRWRDWSR